MSKAYGLHSQPVTLGAREHTTARIGPSDPNLTGTPAVTVKSPIALSRSGYGGTLRRGVACLASDRVGRRGLAG
jgi:hypothetical protein